MQTATPQTFKHSLPFVIPYRSANVAKRHWLTPTTIRSATQTLLLADLIAQLSVVPNADSAVIYVSDHGQSLGEGGNYLHGLPISVAPKEQRDVPLLVWMSDGFQQSRGIITADIIPAQTYLHDFPFHSVMGAFGMKSDIYKPEYDIFHLPR